MPKGWTPPSLSTGCVGVLVPAGVPIPENGVIAPDGGTGILMSSGLEGTSRAGSPGM